ncbi:MAG: PBP1A family penicillin-binding protein [Woeseia sp.]
MNATSKETRGADGRPRRYARWLVLLAGLSACGGLALTAGVIGAYYYVEPGLPDAATIREIPLQIPLRIYSRDGRLIEEIGERRRILVSYQQLPPYVVDAFIAAEDRRFFVHRGIDYRGILRAGISLMRTGSISESGGGSTITQQLARDYFLTRERLFSRKIREAFLAWRIEQRFSKQEIMALFVNKMFFGQRAYGVAAAAQVYFGKPLAEINIAEAATLAGVLPAPSEYNPVRSPTNSLMRRSYVLGRMHDLDMIDDQELEEAMAYPLESRLYGTANELSAPYVAEMVRREMLERYGEQIYSSGYKVVTTLDSRLQASATYALQNGLQEFSRRRGYHGPIAQLEVDTAILQQPYTDWPEELRLRLAEYSNPGQLSVGLVTALVDDNSANVVLQDGNGISLPWYTIRWARPFIDAETAGPFPENVANVLAPGDVIYVMPVQAGGWALAQLPVAQAAVVSVDPRDGAITSLSGGYDFSISKFNRVTQSARQPGSSFKPFLYSAALQYGNTPATVILDAPVVIDSSELEAVWRPINYSGRFYGAQRMREALVRSMNLASVRLLLYNTGVGNAVRHLANFGFSDATLPRNGSLALGGGSASPLDMAQAFATFANGGYAVKPYVIDSISGPDDEMLYRAEPLVVCPECETDDQDIVDLRADLRPDNMPDAGSDAVTSRPALTTDGMTLEQMVDVAETYRPDASVAPGMYRDVRAAPRVISAQNAYLIQDMMREVITRGTGRRATQLGRNDLSGKTGTSNDRRDAWFGGFNTRLSAVVWVGYDDYRPLGPGEEGSRTALPLWIEFMRSALRGVPSSAMPMPEGVITVRINKRTGCPARASDPYEDVMFEIFEEGALPECEVQDDQVDIFNQSIDDSGREEPIF